MTQHSDWALPLQLRHYARVSQVIYSLLAAEKGEPHKACLFFSIAGAEILRKHYGIEAAPIVGAALYRVGTSGADVLAFTEPSEAFVTSTSQAFHSWVVADAWLLDFIAPLFPDDLSASGQSVTCPRRAFQRPASDDKTSLEELKAAGDSIHVPNTELTEDLLRNFSSKPVNGDLVQLAVDWFKRPPKAMTKGLKIGDARGNVKSVPLLDLKLSGNW